MRVFLTLFIVIPVIEMWGLIQVGSVVGAGMTILLVLATAAIGLALLRQQGLATMLKAQQKAANGQMPVHEMVEAVFFAVGGALLLTPGFFTDFIGFCCLVPGIRHLIIGWGLRHIQLGNAFNVHNNVAFRVDAMNDSPPHHSEETTHQAHVIDGEFTRDDSSGDKTTKT